MILKKIIVGKLNQHFFLYKFILLLLKKENNMKKLFILMCLSSFLFGYSQEKETVDFKRNELKGNALLLVIGAGEFTYERLLSEESGVGVSLFFNYDDQFYTKFSLTPFYRFYFSKKPAAGFFVEGFGMMNSYDSYVYNNNSYDPSMPYNSNIEDRTDFALGFGLGSKWINKKGFLFEINAGVGRNLFNSNDTDNEIVGRGGITLGYRF